MSQQTSPATAVLVLLTAKPGVTREQIMAAMPAEIRATIQIYLEGKIRDWYSREDGKGVAILLNTKTVEEAMSVMEPLPLTKQHLLDHEYIALSPLQPLRLLLASAAATP